MRKKFSWGLPANAPRKRKNTRREMESIEVDDRNEKDQKGGWKLGEADKEGDRQSEFII